jgi:transcriptional regulator of acetoin/glycerol metabolism
MLKRQQVIAILDALAEGLIIVDDQGRIAEINRAACEMLDVTKAAAMRTRCIDLLARSFGPTAAAIDDALREGRRLEPISMRLRAASVGRKIVATTTPFLAGKSPTRAGAIHLRELGEPSLSEQSPDGRPAELERSRQVLQQSDWNVAKAARRLGVSRTTLYRRIERLRMARPEEE